MHLHNTLSGHKEVFTPQDPNRVTMYVCGPTVYSFAHIGNYRPAVVFDVLARVLRRRFPNVVYARNITDIDDKINAAAAKEAVEIGVITERFTTAYHEDLAALGVAPPDAEPRVTAHIAQIISMIERLIAAGHAYEAKNHVLFDVPSYPDYGQLSKRDTREMLAGARVEVAPYKKDPGDFVLWKPSTPEQPGWDSPWGRGRPGWHIECSAMVEALLGETIDIHGGGHDLVFPHHENERAQSTCAHGGKVFARYWLHNGFLTMDSAKMSKSVGNVLLLREVLKHAPGEAIRLALLTGHYRQPLDWNDEALADAKKKLDRLYGALRDAGVPDSERAKHGGAGGDAASALAEGPTNPNINAGEVTASDAKAPDAFIEALEDDLNTPAALAELFELARTLNKANDASEKSRLAAQMRDAGTLLGLLQKPAADWFHGAQLEAHPTSAAGLTASLSTLSPEEIEARIAARAVAKKAKNYAESDRIRDELKSRGVLIEDSAQGTRWRLI